MFGYPINRWLKGTDYPIVLATALMGAGTAYSNNAAHSYVPVTATVAGCPGCWLGMPGTTTRTTIKFRYFTPSCLCI